MLCERWTVQNSGDAAVGAAAVDLIVALEEAATPEFANRVATIARSKIARRIRRCRQDIAIIMRAWKSRGEICR